MSRELRPSDYAILGTLAQFGPLSGYDIKNQLDRAVSPFWNESFGQIYPSLALLESLGLIEGAVDASSSRGRKSYRVTPAGRKVIREWLSLPPMDERPRSQTLLKVILGDLVPLEVTLGHLEGHAVLWEERVKVLQLEEANLVQEDSLSPSFAFYLAAIRAGIRIAQARVEWAKEAIDILKHHKKKDH